MGEEADGNKQRVENGGRLAGIGGVQACKRASVQSVGSMGVAKRHAPEGSVLVKKGSFFLEAEVDGTRPVGSGGLQAAGGTK